MAFKGNYSLFDMLGDKGRYGDTELAHITQDEAQLLKSFGGAGTVNPETGLKEYHGSLLGWSATPSGHPYHHDSEGLETTKQERTSESPTEDWEGFKNLNPDDLIGMSDEEKLHLARKLSGDYGMTMDEMHKYMPSFDERGFQNIQREKGILGREAASDITGIGMGQRANLLELAMGDDARKSKSGFAVTGNPMIDKQRQNIYQDIDRTSKGRWDSLLDDVWRKDEEAFGLKEDYQEDLGTRIIDHETYVDLPGDDDDEVAEEKWYKPWTWR